MYNLERREMARRGAIGKAPVAGRKDCDAGQIAVRVLNADISGIACDVARDRELAGAMLLHSRAYRKGDITSLCMSSHRATKYVREIQSRS